MKNIILTFLIALLPSALFSYEISFTKQFTHTVTPDLLTTYVTVSVEDTDESFINEKIEIFNNYINNNKDVIKNDGSYTLSPKYRYYKDKQEFEGFVGRLRYEIKSEDAKKINRFLDDMVSLKKKAETRKVKLNIANVTWITSDKLYKKSLDELRIDAILWIESYSKSLKQKISKNCEIKNINIDSVNKTYIRNETITYSTKMSSNVAPINSDKEISINPNFVLECK